MCEIRQVRGNFSSMGLSVCFHTTIPMTIFFPGNSKLRNFRVLHANLLRTRVAVSEDNPLPTTIWGKVPHFSSIHGLWAGRVAYRLLTFTLAPLLTTQELYMSICVFKTENSIRLKRRHRLLAFLKIPFGCCENTIGSQHYFRICISGR